MLLGTNFENHCFTVTEWRARQLKMGFHKKFWLNLSMENEFHSFPTSTELCVVLKETLQDAWEQLPPS